MATHTSGTGAAERSPDTIPVPIDERLIGRVFGNLHIERPEITRDQVAQVLRLHRMSENTNATKR